MREGGGGLLKAVYIERAKAKARTRVEVKEKKVQI